MAPLFPVDGNEFIPHDDFRSIYFAQHQDLPYVTVDWVEIFDGHKNWIKNAINQISGFILQRTTYAEKISTQKNL